MKIINLGMLNISLVLVTKLEINIFVVKYYITVESILI